MPEEVREDLQRESILSYIWKSERKIQGEHKSRSKTK
jgi:hypothetical protein